MQFIPLANPVTAASLRGCALRVRWQCRLESERLVSGIRQCQNRCLPIINEVKSYLHHGIQNLHTRQPASIDCIPLFPREYTIDLRTQALELGRMRQEVVEYSAQRIRGRIGACDNRELAVREDRLDGGRLELRAVFVCLSVKEHR